MTGPQPYQGRELGIQTGSEQRAGSDQTVCTKIFMGLAKLFLEKDLALIEINPLVITEDGDLHCLDAKAGC